MPAYERMSGWKIWFAFNIHVTPPALISFVFRIALIMAGWAKIERGASQPLTFIKWNIATVKII